jgi:putative phosphoribosyl transferase
VKTSKRICTASFYSRNVVIIVQNFNSTAFRGMFVFFRDRAEAGHILAKNLSAYKDKPDVLVLGLPRGGVPVAYEVARELNAPLDVFIVRKLGMPGHEELAMGAIATSGVRILNESVIQQLGIPSNIVDMVTAREQQELQRRERLYRGESPPPVIKDRTVIIVDDGLATGSSMKAAVAALRQQQPSRLIIAVPTAPVETCAELRKVADEIVCPMTPEPFYAVGGSYVDFRQTTDEEVRNLISLAA